MHPSMQITRSLQVSQIPLPIIPPKRLMDRHQPLQKHFIHLLELLLVTLSPHKHVNQFLAIARGLDGQFSPFADNPTMLLPEGRIVGLAQDLRHRHGRVLDLGKGHPDKSEQPHHPQQVPGSGVVLLIFFGRLLGGIIVTVVDMYPLGHLHPHKRQKSSMILKGLVVAPNDCHLLLDIREGDTQEGVQCLEDEAELVQDCTELCERDLFLRGVGLDAGFELFYDTRYVEFLHVALLLLCSGKGGGLIKMGANPTKYGEGPPPRN